MSGADDRVMLAAARADAVFGLDADPCDGEAGQLLLVRKFDGAAPPDPARVAGRFSCAGRTLIVDPANGRGLQFRGLLTLAASGEFDLEVAPLGSIPGYTVAGTWTLAADGGLTLPHSTAAETWFAAIDRGYDSIVFVDDVVEVGTAPRFSLGFGVREKTPN
jgi:hypothetical protein